MGKGENLARFLLTKKFISPSVYLCVLSLIGHGRADKHTTGYTEEHTVGKITKQQNKKEKKENKKYKIDEHAESIFFY